MEYTYSFAVWPDESWKMDQPIYDLFRAMGQRVEMAFTSEEFERFRSSLSRKGLTLREVSRIPYTEPEPVY